MMGSRFLRSVVFLLLLAAAPAHAALSLQNQALLLTVQEKSGAIAVQDKRNGKTWRQEPISTDVMFTNGFVTPGNARQMELDGLAFATKVPVKCVIALESDAPEFTLSITGAGAMPQALSFPQPFVGGEALIVPINEGIRYPVGDATIQEMRLPTYQGHGGLSMAFWGVTDGEAAQMGILETPDDGRIEIKRRNGALYILPQSMPQKGAFGYERRFRYVFFDHGGYVALCKRYRAYAQRIGLFKTLEEKRQKNPNVDRLLGAVNLWYWDDKDSVAMAREMIRAGIDRILWSHASPPYVGELNQLGLLTGCYDLYQDIMNPAMYPKLNGIHPDWIPEAWPSQVVLDAQGKPVEGWKVTLRDGTRYPCGALSDRFALGYAQKRIAADLKKSPYRVRYIDTTTATGWREDYSPDHPETRSESRRYRMDLLNLVSHDFHLVTGSETGVDVAVPYLDYFEGMLSLAPYRLPEIGRKTADIWHEPIPEDLIKFQTGTAYRLPLWELVYHECVVSNWFWDDFSNKMPSLWDRRDQFNALYGTVPMFRFDRKFWEEHKARFVQSYRNTCPLARRVGTSEMTDHRWLTPDGMVQQSRFANGVTVTVNFGAEPYSLDALVVAPGGISVSGLTEKE